VKGSHHHPYAPRNLLCEGERDFLVVSVGGNDVAAAPALRTVLSLLLLTRSPDWLVRRGRAPGFGHLLDNIFGGKVEEVSADPFAFCLTPFFPVSLRTRALAAACIVALRPARRGAYGARLVGSFLPPPHTHVSRTWRFSLS